MIEILLLQTLAAHAGGESAHAMYTLEQALALAQPGGFIRIFVDEGAPLAALLATVKAEDTRLESYVHRLLTAFAGDSDLYASPAAQQRATPNPMIETLSEREIEVLQLIAEGLTNQEIAATLYISLNTVKVHTRNIYGKLGAHHRTEAVAKARALGMLSPA